MLATAANWNDQTPPSATLVKLIRLDQENLSYSFLSKLFEHQTNCKYFKTICKDSYSRSQGCQMLHINHMRFNIPGVFYTVKEHIDEVFTVNI